MSSRFSIPAVAELTRSAVEGDRPMGVEEDIRLRLSAQRALLTHITPRLRAVSLDYDTRHHWVWVRFAFDGQPSESDRDVALCASTEILADYPEGWNISEEFMVCPVPDQMEHRRILVYHRCEDSWVTDAKPFSGPASQVKDKED